MKCCNCKFYEQTADKKEYMCTQYSKINPLNARREVSCDVYQSKFAGTINTLDINKFKKRIEEKTIGYLYELHETCNWVECLQHAKESEFGILSAENIDSIFKKSESVFELEVENGFIDIDVYDFGGVITLPEGLKECKYVYYFTKSVECPGASPDGSSNCSNVCQTW